jgi:hypothetical protein
VGHILAGNILGNNIRQYIAPFTPSAILDDVEEMKFGKLVSRAEELLPDVKHLCVRYKFLKKLLKNMRPGAQARGGEQSLTAEEP